MKAFPPEVKFTKTWRPYQQRVLSEMEQHLDDNHLHVVAAPGSGKTVLGLEVARRLNKPALILSPTLTIRDQWVDRFVHLFLPEGLTRPDWISTDIRKPGLITAVTYQALHCAYSGEAEEPVEEKEPEEETGEIGEFADVVEHGNSEEITVENGSVITGILQSAGIGTVIVDEAHHLRSHWWNSLISVVKKLDKPSIVALTATPPYDVAIFEWDRYKELCGPVDAEISAPELVLDGNLCPHQDYIYLNWPSEEELGQIEEFRKNVEEFQRDLVTNEEFISAIEAHPWLNRPKHHVEAILSNPGYFSSIAIFVNAARGRVPESLLPILGASDKPIPPLTLERLEVLLTGRLFTDAKEIGEWDGMLKLIRERLNRIGAVERRQVFLRNSPRLDRKLISSTNKLQSIADIVDFEHSAISSDMRMVILTDFIRISEMPDSPIDIKPLNKIGVVPVFEKIRRECPKEIRLGVLSGSLVIVPASSEELLRKICADEGIEPSQVNLHPLYHDPDYCRVVVERDVQAVVQLITRLFSDGGITVLVGTKSLLGEGWDAPSVNSLILASFVGSYMLSNQMRGRAIRCLPGNAEKTANVWHLVCVQPNSEDAGADLATLQRRFKAFVGVSFKDKVIENGIERLGLGAPPYSPDKLRSVNDAMCQLALDRAGLRQRWEEALFKDGSGRMVQEVISPTKALPRAIVLANSNPAFLLQAGFAIGLAATGFFTPITKIFYSMPLNALDCCNLISWIGTFITFPWFIMSLLHTAEHGTGERSIKQVGLALLDAMIGAQLIKTPLSKLKVIAQRESDLSVSCGLDGGTSYECSIFADSLQEMLDPMDNPRYMISVRSCFSSKPYYFAVPYLLAQNKKTAEYFADVWQRYVGPQRLIFTRNVEGRQILLKARSQSLAGAAQSHTERISCWK